MRVEVAKVPDQIRDVRAKDILASLCYHYPQYTLSEARKLPYRDVKLLLREARRQKAIEWHWQTLIAAAPGSPKGKGVKELLKVLKRQID